jgi:hypothetical protein
VSGASPRIGPGTRLERAAPLPGPSRPGRDGAEDLRRWLASTLEWGTRSLELAGRTVERCLPSPLQIVAVTLVFVLACLAALHAVVGAPPEPPGSLAGSEVTRLRQVPDQLPMVALGQHR